MQKIFCLIENIFVFMYLIMNWRMIHYLTHESTLLLQVWAQQSKGKSPTQNAQAYDTTGNTVKVLSFKYWYVHGKVLALPNLENAYKKHEQTIGNDMLFAAKTTANTFCQTVVLPFTLVSHYFGTGHLDQTEPSSSKELTAGFPRWALHDYSTLHGKLIRGEKAKKTHNPNLWTLSCLVAWVLSNFENLVLVIHSISLIIQLLSSEGINTFCVPSTGNDAISCVLHYCNSKKKWGGVSG